MLIDSKLPRSKPEVQGVSSSAVLGFFEAVERQSQGKKNQELHSFMLARHGYVVAEGWWSPYTSQHPHMLFSLSKSFTSTAIGMAVSEGLLSIDDFVVSFFPEDVPEDAGKYLTSMRVKNLLTMTTGNTNNSMEYMFRQKDGSWIKGFFSAPVDYLPGTHFAYNTGATYILSAIIQKITGNKLIDYLQPRLFEPLGIEGATWEVCPKGINTGGYGLSIKTEDLAKFGQLYLQKGYWNGRWIIPEAWVEEATISHISTFAMADSGWSQDWTQGYGYQFWRCCNNSFRADGAYGQLCVVIPEQDALIAITGGVSDIQAVLNLIWEYLLPAMKNVSLPVERSSQMTLEKKLCSLKLAIPEGKEFDHIVYKVSGTRYILEQNSLNLKDIIFVFDKNRCTIYLQDETHAYKINCGIGTWLEEELSLKGNLLCVATYCIWSGNTTFTIDMRFIEAPFYYTFACNFEGSILIIDIFSNISFEPNMPQHIKGRIEEQELMLTL